MMMLTSWLCLLTTTALVASPPSNAAGRRRAVVVVVVRSSSSSSNNRSGNRSENGTVVAPYLRPRGEEVLPPRREEVRPRFPRAPTDINRREAQVLGVVRAETFAALGGLIGVVFAAYLGVFLTGGIASSPARFAPPDDPNEDYGAVVPGDIPFQGEEGGDNTPGVVV